MSVRVLLITALPACLVQEIDLRTPPDPQALVAVCDPGQRFIEGRGCVHCEVMDPPQTTCPCGWWEYQPADLPWCDTPEAFYRCLPCTGDIDSCNGYSDGGTSSSCFLLERCCEQLALDADSVPCCTGSDILRCALDPGRESALVGCLPADCCNPACHPTLEVCDVVASDGDLVCVCNEAIAP